MAEVYATPDHISPEPQEVSVDTLAREELEGILGGVSIIETRCINTSTRQSAKDGGLAASAAC